MRYTDPSSHECVEEKSNRERTTNHVVKEDINK